MKPKPLHWATLGWSVVVLTLALSGCWRRQVVQRSQSTAEISIPPRKAERIDTDPEKISAALERSVHAKIDCTGCHGANQTRDPSSEVGKGQCSSCHEEEAKAYAETIHAKAIGKGSDAATCEDCHGTHDVLPASDPSSRVSARNTPATCGKCHENPDVAKNLGIKKPLAVRQYVESTHGKALLIEGLMVAPSCPDCHGRAHRIFEVSDPRSTVNRVNVADTCGRCHAGQREKYTNSVHAKVLRDEVAGVGKASEESPNVTSGKHAPSCPACHSAHEIVEQGPVFRLASDKICGDCHQERLHRFLDTYHGRAQSLGDVEVAACFSCHGSHDVWPSSNPASMVSEKNKQATCQQCHPGVSRNFSTYFAHGDHADRKHYPMLYWTFVSMTSLLVGTFGFFGIHTLLWLVRTLILRFRDPTGFREAKLRARKEEGAKLFARFRPIDRFVHFLVIVSFMLLVTTGMPLKFHTEHWAREFFAAMGGASTARSVHRFAAIVTLGYFVLHISSLATLVTQHRKDYLDSAGHFRLRRFLAFAFGPDSPFPRLQDVKDVAGHMKWFFGRGPRPKFDRFTYWEKFDYIAVFWGVTVIGLSGLIMWFPETFTRVLPGWAINIAHIIHSDEALLAAGFIFTFHFFNSHFRPEKFPFDPVMFSGHITEEELRHERPALYERMAAAGELEESKSLGDWPEWRPITNAFGACAIVIGLSLSALIFWALLR